MRAQIVEVAAGLLASGGRDAVSTRAVAAAAGTQAPTIYRLFGDKDGLLAAVLEYGFATYLSIRRPTRSRTSGRAGTCTSSSGSRTRPCSC
jgi:AcrR family transcriptional regulator